MVLGKKMQKRRKDKRKNKANNRRKKKKRGKGGKMLKYGSKLHILFPSRTKKP